MKEKVIQLMKHEISQLERVEDAAEVNKHLYTLEKLIHVLKDSEAGEELRVAKESPDNGTRNDDDSIFDF